MGVSHLGGNQVPEITREEHWHQEGVGGKNVYVRDANGNIVSTFGGSISGNVTVNPGPNQIGSVTISHPITLSGFSGPTIYAVVNTSAAGQSSIVLDAGISQIGSVTISHPITIAGFSGPTIYAVVNTAAAGQASVVLDTGSKWIGLATTHVSNVVNSIVTIAPRTDYLGLMSVSGNVAVSAVASMATIYAIVNTGAVGDTNALATLLAGPNQIGSVTVSNTVNALATTTPSGTVSVAWNSGATVAVSNLPSLPVGTATIGIVTANTNLLAGSNFVGLATVVNGAGTAQMGSVTVSNVINSITTIAPRTDYIGLMSVSGNVVNLAGTAQMGSVTVSNTVNALGTVNVANVIGSIVTIAPRTDYIGLMSISGNIATVNQVASVATIYAIVNTAAAGQASVVIDAGTKQIGSVTISHPVVLSGFSGPTIYAVVNTAAAGQASVVLDTGTKFIGLATVVVGAGTSQMGSVTVSNMVNASATIVSMSSGKTWLHAPIAVSATNLSGATILISAASKRFYITNIVLSTASNVGLTWLNGPTYLAGNASIRMSIPAQGGLSKDGNVDGPLYKGLADQTNLLLVTDTAAPIAGDVIWYEE